MAIERPNESPLETAAGAVGSHTAEAFEALANETRLAALLALWEEHEPFADDTAVSFGELRRRVGMSDPGQFHYHLDKLVGLYVVRSDDGYSLNGAGQSLVQAVVAGVGIEEPTFETTVEDLDCPVCGATPSYEYEDGYVVGRCPECAERSADGGVASEGGFQRFSFDPAGVMSRSPIDVLEANSIQTMWEAAMRTAGVCPQCSGSVEAELLVCDDHDAGSSRCSTCGRRNRFAAKLVCTVCKDALRFPPHCIAELHPRVMAHLQEHVYEYAFGLEADDEMRSFDELATSATNALETETELVAESPPRVRVRFDCETRRFVVTLDDDVKIADIEEIDLTTG